MCYGHLVITEHKFQELDRLCLPFHQLLYFLFSVGNKKNTINVQNFLCHLSYEENPKLIKVISEFTDQTELCCVKPTGRKEKNLKAIHLWEKVVYGSL